MFIFLDESGDLGFDFEKEGTSKTFTITLLVCNKSCVKRIKKSVKRTLKNKVNAKRKRKKTLELKGTDTAPEIKSYFLKHMPENGWGIYSITVNKERVYEHLRTKEGKKKLYNFLTKELLKSLRFNIEQISTVNLIVDRCKDGEDRKDFNAYIKANLETTFPIETPIYITHEASHENAGLQAVDLFCYGIHRKENLKHNRENT